MVISDVGQGRFEEVNYLPLSEARGANFGWKAYEGLADYNCGPEKCPFGGPPELAAPVTWPQLVYPHEEGCAVIGGPIISDPTLRGLTGRLIYGDFCTNDVKTVAGGPGTLSEQRPLGAYLPPGPDAFAALNGIGEDGWGRIYLLTNRHHVYRLVPRSTLRK